MESLPHWAITFALNFLWVGLTREIQLELSDAGINWTHEYAWVYCIGYHCCLASYPNNSWDRIIYVNDNVFRGCVYDVCRRRKMDDERRRHLDMISRQKADVQNDVSRCRQTKEKLQQQIRSNNHLTTWDLPFMETVEVYPMNICNLFFPGEIMNVQLEGNYKILKYVKRYWLKNTEKCYFG